MEEPPTFFDMKLLDGAAIVHLLSTRKKQIHGNYSFHCFTGRDTTSAFGGGREVSMAGLESIPRSN